MSKKKKKQTNVPHCSRCAGFAACGARSGDTPTLRVRMAKRTNGKTGKQFWGCGAYPRCSFTLELLDFGNQEGCNCYPLRAGGSLRKSFYCAATGSDCPTWIKPKKEEIMEKDPLPQALQFFKAGLWYIIRKPHGGLHSQPLSRETTSGTISWVTEMDKCDGLVVKCSRIDKGYDRGSSRLMPTSWNNKTRNAEKDVAYFDDICSFGYHSSWVLGPFATNSLACASEAAGLAGLAARRSNSKSKSQVLAKDENVEVHHAITVATAPATGDLQVVGGPRVGLLGHTSKNVAVMAKIKKKSSILKTIRNRWRKTPSKASPSTVHASLKDKCQQDIDDIFSEFHKRTSQREKLNARIEDELKAPSKFKRLRYVLKRTAIVVASGALGGWVLSGGYVILMESLIF